jgi:hypothetical protein
LEAAKTLKLKVNFQFQEGYPRKDLSNFSMADVEGCRAHIIEADSNGSCLFISLRLGLELHAVLEKHRGGTPVTSACLDGRAPAMIKSAEDLRAMIVQWYSEGLNKEVPGAEPRLKRGDILAIEMVRHSRDVPAEGPLRDAAIQQYLDAMKRRGTWGSTPEYVAFTMMSKLRVRVFQPTARPQGQSAALGPELRIVDEVVIENANGVVNLLFDGHSHYDLLIDAPAVVKAAWPIARITERHFK